MLCIAEIFNHQVSPYIRRPRKSNPCFHWLLTVLFQRPVFWYEQAKHLLHLIQNAAAWYVTLSKRRDCITSALIVAHHCLVVSFRIDFKILVFQALYGHAFAYISDPPSPYEPDCCYRSSDEAQLKVSSLDYSLNVTVPLLSGALSWGSETGELCILL